MHSFLIALQFLTIFPVRPKSSPSAQDLSSSARYFPLVGLIIGAHLVIINDFCTHLFSPLLVNTIIIITLSLITGGLHLDGFVDTMDGILSGKKEKEEILKIMRDSRIGSMGMISLFFLLILKISLLGEIDCFKNSFLFILPVFSRWSMVISFTLFPYARKDDGLGKLFTSATKTDLILSTIICLFLGILILKIRGIIIIIITLITTYASSSYLKKKIGGITGDTLGAINEINELVILVTFLLIFPPTK